MDEWIKPTTLTGEYVVLRPMQLHDTDLLSRTVDISEYNLLRQGGPEKQTSESFREYFSKIMDETNRVEFLMLDARNGVPIGHTAYMNIRPHDRVAEIGHTVIGAAFQGKVYNTESKFLLLRHAFEMLRAVRIEIKTDTRNAKSQAAIERLGAVREGILRCYNITYNGYVRDVAMYSIIQKEWPEVRGRLLERIRLKAEAARATS